MSIPKNLQSVLWSKNTSRLDLKKDREYIIHQVLSRGTLKQMQWVMRSYGRPTVRRVFENHPQRAYSQAALNFSSKFILGCKNIRTQHYVKAPLKHS